MEETEIMGDRICKAIVPGVAALLLAASACIIAGPAAAQWRGAQPFAPGVSAPSFDARRDHFLMGQHFWSDSCWQVRPIYSRDGAWLDNRRVNVCP